MAWETGEPRQSGDNGRGAWPPPGPPPAPPHPPQGQQAPGTQQAPQHQQYQQPQPHQQPPPYQQFQPYQQQFQAPSPYPPRQTHAYAPYAWPAAPPARRRTALPLRFVPFRWFYRLVAWDLRTARRAAERVCVRDHQNRIHDPLVERVQLTRSVLGLVATLAMIYVYGTQQRVSLDGAVTDGLGNLLGTPLVLLLSGPLVTLGFFLYAPSESRAGMRSGLRAPLVSVGYYVLIIVGALGLLFGLANPKVLNSLHGWVAFAWAVPVFAYLCWGLPFVGFASYFSAKLAFNTACVHPMLPAVITSVCVWVIAAFDFISDGMPGGPLPVQLASLFGGPLSVTAISLWELRRMRTRHGVVLRG